MARRVRSGGRRGSPGAPEVTRPAVCPRQAPSRRARARGLVTAQSPPVARAMRSSVPAVRAERSLRVARAEPNGPRRGGVCARGALPRQAGPAGRRVARGGPAPAPGGGASAVRRAGEPGSRIGASGVPPLPGGGGPASWPDRGPPARGAAAGRGRGRALLGDRGAAAGTARRRRRRLERRIGRAVRGSTPGSSSTAEGRVARWRSGVPSGAWSTACRGTGWPSGAAGSGRWAAPAPAIVPV
ncbi:hypothetical protein HBB16_19280 [Pseudonocardia sp. MCCB 268]|nr:hypothetical protein [Pseudonocardia cytotoxica]